MKNFLRLFACIAIAMSGCGCYVKTDVPPHRPALASPNDMGTELLVPDMAPAQYHPVRYQYIMPESQQRRILRDAPGLRVGDDIEDVERRLGLPLSDELLTPIDSSRPSSRGLHYYFAKRDLKGSNNFDPDISIFFDAHNKLKSMVSNIPAIPNINWPPTRGAGGQ